MRNVLVLLHHLCERVAMLLLLIVDAVRFLVLCLRPAPALAAENLFLHKQLTLYQERQAKPRQATNAIRLAMIGLSRWFEWRSALNIVLQALIRRMALENLTWGQERIANELSLKLGLTVSPRTVCKYMPDHCVKGPGKYGQSQRWSTFIRNHAKGIVACDFFVTVTMTFRLLYLIGVIEHASRRLLHVNVTAHPTAPWTMQQFREAIPADHTYSMLIHDRDAIFSKAVDQSVSRMGLHIIKTPVRTPVANSVCQRVIGTLRRKCLDLVIPLNDKHPYGILKEWVAHYNQGRPHMSLGPGIPKPIQALLVPRQAHRHRLPTGLRVVARPILGGLHHEYGLENRAT